MKNIWHLSFKSIMGRKKENSILLSMIILSIVFLTTFLIYNASSSKGLEETRKDLYGQWYTLTYDQKEAIISQDGLSSVIEQTAYIVSNNTTLGSIGIVDQQFTNLGKIKLLSGNMPTQEGEIALTTSLLDSLGYSYDLGSIVNIPLLPLNTSLEDLQTKLMEPEYVEYKLVGILPAYDVFWKKGEDQLVNAIVSDFDTGFHKTQVLWKGNDSFDSYNLIESKDTVVNEFAYPSKDNFDYSLLIIQIAVICLAFISNLIIYSFILNKRRNSLVIMSNVGATKSMVIKLLLIESLIILVIGFVIGIPMGQLVGIGLAMMTKGSSLSIPWNHIVLLLILLFITCFISFLISSIIVRIDNPYMLRSTKVKLVKKVKIDSKTKLSVLILTSCIFIVSIGTLYLSKWVMMPYDKNVAYAALNTQSKSGQYFTENIINDLRKIPEVQEVSAINYIPNEFFATSPDIRNSKVYTEIYESSNPAMPIYFYKRGILSTHFFVLSDDCAQQVLELSDIDGKDIERFKTGNGILYYQNILEKDLTTGTIYNFLELQNSNNYEILAVPVYKGNFLTISSNQFVDEENHDYTVSNVFNEDTEVLGVVTSLNDQLLFGNNMPILNGSIFISQEFYRKLIPIMENRFVSENEYTNINIKIDTKASYATRKSISSIITSRGGMLQSDSYEVVSNLYRECSQKSLILILSGIIIILFSFILLWNIISSSLLSERKRIGILQGLGVENSRCLLAYFKKSLKSIIPSIALANIICIGFIQFFNQSKYLIENIKIYTYTTDIYFYYPIGELLFFNVVLFILILFIQVYPVAKLIRNEPIENIKESGGMKE